MAPLHRYVLPALLLSFSIVFVVLADWGPYHPRLRGSTKVVKRTDIARSGGINSDLSTINERRSPVGPDVGDSSGEKSQGEGLQQSAGSSQGRNRPSPEQDSDDEGPSLQSYRQDGRLSIQLMISDPARAKMRLVKAGLIPQNGEVESPYQEVAQLRQNGWSCHSSRDVDSFDKHGKAPIMKTVQDLGIATEFWSANTGRPSDSRLAAQGPGRNRAIDCVHNQVSTAGGRTFQVSQHFDMIVVFSCWTNDLNPANQC